MIGCYICSAMECHCHFFSVVIPMNDDEEEQEEEEFDDNVVMMMMMMSLMTMWWWWSWWWWGGGGVWWHCVFHFCCCTVQLLACYCSECCLLFKRAGHWVTCNVTICFSFLDWIEFNDFNQSQVVVKLKTLSMSIALI